MHNCNPERLKTNNPVTVISKISAVTVLDTVYAQNSMFVSLLHFTKSTGGDCTRESIGSDVSELVSDSRCRLTESRGCSRHARSVAFSHIFRLSTRWRIKCEMYIPYVYITLIFALMHGFIRVDPRDWD